MKMLLEAKLKLEVEIHNEDAEDDPEAVERIVADQVREHIVAAIDAWDYCETDAGTAELEVSMLYFDDYEEPIAGGDDGQT